MVDTEFEADDSFEPVAPVEEGQPQALEGVGRVPRPDLLIFSILDSIDFAAHFVIIGDVGTGKSTTTPIYEFEKSGRSAAEA